MEHGSTEKWRVFQDRVAACFRRIRVCRVTVGEKFKGARGNHEVDVAARIGSPDHGLVFTVLVECKAWKTRVPQEKILALKAIVEDVGANLGILVSEVGHQKGKREYLNSPINVIALTLAEIEILTFAKIEAMTSAKLGITTFGPREMHMIACSECGRQIPVPFGPTEGKFMCCSECYSSSLPAGSARFDFITSNLGKDVESALQVALAGRAVFENGTDPLFIFRQALAASIRDIQTHPRGRLFQEFLLKGPYEDIGKIPAELIGQRLSDIDTAAAITFIYSHMVNCFKGTITELLAAKPCMELMRWLRRNNDLPRNTRLYVGDSVRIHTANGKRLLKGADLHFMTEPDEGDSHTCVSVVGVVEVKSYTCSKSRLSKQLDHHLLRARRGLRVSGVDYPAEMVKMGYGKNRRVLRISVLPSGWKLPRSFRFEATKHGRSLHVDPGVPAKQDDQIERIKDDRWQITLKWSEEALAAAAYEMTFWYMGMVGEAIYSHGVPKEWSKMTPEKAGRNAVKMMLYYAIQRCRNNYERQRAIALYNSYGFGYALGMNFKDAKGKHEMLWPDDLDEILADGRTKHGCRLD